MSESGLLNSEMQKDKKKYFYDFYYLIVILVYFSAIYIPQIRLGVFMSIVMLYLLYYLVKNNLFSIRTHLDIIVIFYIIYNTISILWFLWSGLPIDVFIMEYSNSILPIICFYFIGRIYRKDTDFFKITLYALVVCFIIGFYFQLTLPENYREFMAKMDDSGETDPVSFFSGFRSLLGLTATGSLGSIGVLISLAIVSTSKVKKGKFVLLICFFALVLTFRRSALYVAVFAFLWINYLFLFKFKIARWKLFIFEILAIFLFVLLINSLYPDFLKSVSTRFGALSSAVDERKSNWFEGLTKASNLIIGDGLGKFGHKAAQYTDNILPDGNYFRIIAELGIFGLLIFIAIIFVALKKGLTQLADNYIEIGIVIMLCLQAIGSDIFSFQLIAPIFWYSIGRCGRIPPNNNKKSDIDKHNKTSVESVPTLCKSL